MHRLAHRGVRSSQATPAAVDKSPSASNTKIQTVPIAGVQALQFLCVLGKPRHRPHLPIAPTRHPVPIHQVVRITRRQPFPVRMVARSTIARDVHHHPSRLRRAARRVVWAQNHVSLYRAVATFDADRSS